MPPDGGDDGDIGEGKEYGDGQENGEGGEDGENKDNKGKGTKGAKKKRTNTIEKNPENLLLKTFDTEFEVDPLFKKTSAAFDEGGARGLLLNNLSVYKDCELVFDSFDTMPHGTDAEVETFPILSPCN